jgi:putative aldouronate transport system permease protein
MESRLTTKTTGKTVRASLISQVWGYKALYLMLLPGLAFMFLFSYGPIYGLIIAFKNYSLTLGILGSPWAGHGGFEQFAVFFTDPYALSALKNTIILSLCRQLVEFPAPIILAILINEIGCEAYKKTMQSITYIPHFISWIILGSMLSTILAPETGIVNVMLKAVTGNTIYFMADNNWFRPFLIVTGMLKSVGWSSIIYLAAISNVNPQIYEAAVVDGATRIQRIRFITMPLLASLASIILILSMGGILSGGFDQVFNTYNPMVYSTADIIDTYTYRMGIIGQKYSFAAAVGLFKSAAGLIMVLVVNGLTKKLDSSSETGLM